MLLLTVILLSTVYSSYSKIIPCEQLKQNISIAMKNVNKPKSVILLDGENGNLDDFSCLAQQFTNHRLIQKVDKKPCVHLLTMPAQREELHILITQSKGDVPFCRPHVYGPIPDVIEVRFPPQSTNELMVRDKFVTIQMTSKGGSVRFDVELESEHSMKNLLLILTNLIRISNNAFSYRNGIPNFHRKSHLLADRNQTLEINLETYRAKLEKSMSSDWLSAACLLPLLLCATVIAAIFTTQDRVHKANEAVTIMSETSFAGTLLNTHVMDYRSFELSTEVEDKKTPLLPVEITQPSPSERSRRTSLYTQSANTSVRSMYVAKTQKSDNPGKDFSSGSSEK